jgi:hypothetical protein
MYICMYVCMYPTSPIHICNIYMYVYIYISYTYMYIPYFHQAVQSTTHHAHIYVCIYIYHTHTYVYTVFASSGAEYHPPCPWEPLQSLPVPGMDKVSKVSALVHLPCIQVSKETSTIEAKETSWDKVSKVSVLVHSPLGHWLLTFFWKKLLYRVLLLGHLLVSARVKVLYSFRV